MKKLEIPSKEVLYDLYSEQELSFSQIAVIFNTTSMTVGSWLRNKKIKIRISNINLYKEIRETDFSILQKDLLIGSILGDGCLRIKKRGKNANFSERHSESQRMYLEWKRDLLMPFVQRKMDFTSGGNHIISGVKCVVQNSYRFETIAHPYLTKVWSLFYKGNGNKIIPEDIDKYLNFFVIVVWICDDGSLVWNNIKKSYRMDLHTESFSYSENVLLSRSLHKYFHGRILIYPRKYKNGIRYYLRLSGKEELHIFCQKLKKLIPECMQYKFNTHI